MIEFVNLLFRIFNGLLLDSAKVSPSIYIAIESDADTSCLLLEFFVFVFEVANEVLIPISSVISSPIESETGEKFCIFEFKF